PLQPAARRARPTAAAAATRVVIVSMVPPRELKVAMDAKRRRAHPHRGCPQGGTVASTEIMPRQRCHNQIVKRAAPRPAMAAPPVSPAPRAAAAHMAAPARSAAGLAGLAVAAGALAVAEGPGRATTY